MRPGRNLLWRLNLLIRITGVFIWLGGHNLLSAEKIQPKDIDTRGVMWNSAADKARYVRERIILLNQQIPEFNTKFAAASVAYPDIFTDTGEFVPLFEMEHQWCMTHGDQTINTNAPVSQNYCSNILQTIDNDRRSLQVQLKEGVDWHREFYNHARCYAQYPESEQSSYVRRHVPGTYSSYDKVHICVVKEEEFNKTPQRSIGDIELERYAWKARRASRNSAQAKAEEGRHNIPLMKPDGTLDVGVYECDPTNWKIVKMLHEVGLIRDIEQPLETGGDNIVDWCNNEGKATPNPCTFESDPRNPRLPLPCKQADSYWKFRAPSIGFMPSICDNAVTKALNTAINKGVKFTRFYDSEGHMCKVRFERRKNAAMQ